MLAVASSMRPSHRCVASSECLAQDHRESASSAMCQGYVFGGSRASPLRLVLFRRPESCRHRPTSRRFKGPPRDPWRRHTGVARRQPCQVTGNPSAHIDRRFSGRYRRGQRIGRPTVWIDRPIGIAVHRKRRSAYVSGFVENRTVRLVRRNQRTQAGLCKSCVPVTSGVPAVCLAPAWHRVPRELIASELGFHWWRRGESNP